ncbi:MAG TPA: PorP/SprF family type IX secretion system membrane protein [Bacteroidia bacterium]|nr:PorP/SprF family type IX secretion system membrane protein [Bacteroidia bacterium]
MIRSIPHYFVFAVALLLNGVLLSAQDIHFSQFTQSPLSTNPALVGTTPWIRANLQYRTQWSAVTVAYKTVGASFDIKSKKKWIKGNNKKDKERHAGENGFAWGVNLFNDNAGDGRMNSLQACGSIAYQIYMDERNMIALGFQGGILQRSLTYGKLYWGSQYDPLSATGYNAALPADQAVVNADKSFIIPDLATGGVYSYKRDEQNMFSSDQREINIGLALFHVNMPRYSYYDSNERLYQRLVLHGNAVVGIRYTHIAIVPGFMIQRQGPNQEILLGSLVRYTLRDDSKYTGYIKSTSISAGGYYRNKDAFILAGLLEFSNYAVGLSYDLNVSGLSRVSSGRGGLEFTFRYVNIGAAPLMKNK